MNLSRTEVAPLIGRAIKREQPPAPKKLDEDESAKTRAAVMKAFAKGEYGPYPSFPDQFDDPELIRVGPKLCETFSLTDPKDVEKLNRLHGRAYPREAPQIIVHSDTEYPLPQSGTIINVVRYSTVEYLKCAGDDTNEFAPKEKPAEPEKPKSLENG